MIIKKESFTSQIRANMYEHTMNIYDNYPQLFVFLFDKKFDDMNNDEKIEARELVEKEVLNIISIR